MGCEVKKKRFQNVILNHVLLTEFGLNKNVNNTYNMHALVEHCEI